MIPRNKTSWFTVCAMLALAMPATSLGSGNADHVVTSDATTLFEISIQLYGTPAYWQQIAQINRIENPKTLKLDQRLRLPKPPSLTPEQGAVALRNFWRARFGLTTPSDPDLLKNVQPTLTPESSERKPLEPFVAAVRTPQESRMLTARELFEAGRIQDAAVAFRSARELDPEILPNWFFEMRCLQLSRRFKELREVLMEFEARFPELKEIPAIMPYRTSVAATGAGKR